jgi:hypothetical protein
VSGLDSGQETVPGLLQANLPGAHVVRAFKPHLLGLLSSAEVTTAGRPAGTPNRRALAIAGDDPEAKRVVSAIYDAVGFDALDLGGLDEAWRVDRGQSPFIAHQDLAQLKANVACARPLSLRPLTANRSAAATLKRRPVQLPWSGYQLHYSSAFHCGRAAADRSARNVTASSLT